jgi:MFS family permease
LKVKTKIKLIVMMFLQYLMLPVWLVPLLPYVQSLDGGSEWVFACGLLMGIGTLASPLVGMFADRFLNAEKVLAICNALVALLLAIAFFVTTPAVLFAALLGLPAGVSPPSALPRSREGPLRSPRGREREARAALREPR